MRGGRSSTPQFKIGARESYDSAEHVGRSYNYHFSCYERAFPGRELPEAKGWYGRALLVNLIQLGITLALARVWIHLFGSSLFKLSAWNAPLAEGFVGWFIGTFFFYWWHVLRHKNGFWLVFHQLHHSPSRIEIATSFYKHPIEILSDQS